MRVGGVNVLAVLVAAIAIYAVGFLIYGVLLTPEAWMAMAGLTAEDMNRVGLSRLPYSWIMPVMTAIGMAVLFAWAQVRGAANGIKWGALIALLSAVPALWYGWVYGVDPASGTWLDTGHLMLGHIVAGVILASWK